MASDRETLEAGGTEQVEAAACPGCLVRVGSLAELHRDTAALIPLCGAEGRLVRRVTFVRADAPAVQMEGEELVVACADPWMSQRHATLHVAGGAVHIADEGSRNGVLVEGRRIASGPLGHGEPFVLGRTVWLTHQRPVPGEVLAAAGQLFGPTRSVSPNLIEALLLLGRCAGSDLTVLLQGETGTGKEVLAREVHQRSGRSGPFVAVNCAALPEALIEGQLFGHRRGAFTGATDSAPGLVLASSGGTLFLDEIADMTAGAQAKLLRVLEERAVLPLGETAVRKVDLRVVAASQRDLAAAVEAGRFRRDLYARLAEVVVTLPPLRERRGDLGLLVAHVCGELGATLSLAAARVVLGHDWPMNLRELRSGLRAAAVMAGGAAIEARHLPAAWRVPVEEPPPPEEVADGGPSRDELEALLERHGGNVSAAARELGKGKMQIYRWMARRRIDPRAFR